MNNDIEMTSEDVQSQAGVESCVEDGATTVENETQAEVTSIAENEPHTGGTSDVENEPHAEGTSDVENEPQTEGTSGVETEIQTEVVLFNQNSGWAETMKSIINTKKPKRKKTVVLAKAKKLSCVKPKEENEQENTNTDAANVMRKSDWINIGRLKPSPLERNREKNLQKITVKGVVRLYNAVNRHQKNLTTIPATSKQEKKLKINKQMFLEILRKGSTSEPVVSSDQANLETDSPIKEEDESTIADDSNTWGVLKNDFMSGRKWKNWDKSNTEQEEMCD